MAERGISPSDVRHILENGEIIEDYPDDMPYPSRLVLGFRGMRPIHLVVAMNEADEQAMVITVYEPNPAEWDQRFKRRRS